MNAERTMRSDARRRLPARAAAAKAKAVAALLLVAASAPPNEYLTAEALTLPRAPAAVRPPSTRAWTSSSPSPSSPPSLRASSSSSELSPEDEEPTFWEKVASAFSQTALQNSPQSSKVSYDTPADRARVQLVTLLRVGVPSVLAGVAAFALFPHLALALASGMNDAGVFAVLSQDSSQFVQNFLTVGSLLFSILVGQTYYFMYQQQEAVYYALFDEVTEAKSLLEQVALVCQGRAMYATVLRSIEKYVNDDLKQLGSDPAVLLSARPVDDPLESVMYMTSVGVPSSVYDTVRSLRQARAARLGALQRKLPRVHMILLWLLACIELVSFPLLGAGTQTIGGYNILTVEGCLFGIMTFGIVMTLRVVGELWRPAGGAYNVDAVLSVMVRGLERELKERLAGRGGNERSPGTMTIMGEATGGAPDDGRVMEVERKERRGERG